MPVEFILPVHFQPTKIQSAILICPIEGGKAAPSFLVNSRRPTQTGFRDRSQRFEQYSTYLVTTKQAAL